MQSLKMPRSQSVRQRGRSNCGGIEGISNDIKEIGLAIMGFRTLEISAKRP